MHKFISFKIIIPLILVCWKAIGLSRQKCLSIVLNFLISSDSFLLVPRIFFFKVGSHIICKKLKFVVSPPFPRFKSIFLAFLTSGAIMTNIKDSDQFCLILIFSGYASEIPSLSIYLQMIPD